jgi:hypothetical protein
MATTRIVPEHLDLPSGGWVEFHDPEDLTGADHRRIMAAINGDPSNPRVAMAMDMVYTMAELMVRSWKIPYAPKGTAYFADDVPIPEVAPGVLEKLRMPDYAAIIAAVAPIMSLINGEVSVDDAGKPGTPTRPAGG